MKVTTAMVADAASVEDGKLYVHGGAWDSITAGKFPHVHPTMSLVIVFQIEYNEALQDIPFLIELLDEDDNPVGPKLQGNINAGHAPGMDPGSPISAPNTLTMNLQRFDHPGRYRFRVKSADDELASVSFRVVQRRN